MINKIKNHFIYILWTCLNIFQDTCYKYGNNIPFQLILVSRYLLIFIILSLINYIFKKPQESTPITKALILINIFKSLSTFCGIIFLFLQIRQTNILSTNLIFYTIPLWDFFLQKILNFSILTPRYLTITNIINSSIIFIFFFLQLSWKSYIYGFMSAMMFSISNICIMEGKKHWSNNNHIINDIQIFSLFMLIIAIIYTFLQPAQIHQLINWSSLILISFNGLVIQLFLYYLFFRIQYNPSSLISYWDLILSFIIDVTIGNVRHSYVHILLILSIIITPLIIKKIIKI